MENGTITVISSRPMGPQDYAKLGYDAAMQDIHALYSQIMQRAGGAKGKGDVQPSKDTKSKAAEVKSMGRGRDTELAHIRPDEAKLLKDNGGRGSRNPKTGLLEFDGEGGGDGGGGDSGGDTGGGDAPAGGGDAPAGGGDAPAGGGDAPAGGESSDSAPSYGDFGEGGGWSGDSPSTPSSSPAGGDGLTGGVPGNTVADVNTQGGGQPGGGYGGPSPGGPSAEAFGDYGGISSLGLADQSPSPVAGEASGRSHTNAATNFGIGVNNALTSVLGVMGPIGAIVGGNPSPLGMASSVMGPAGGVMGAAGQALGFGNMSANAFGFNTGVSGSQATGLAGNMGADPDGLGFGQGFGPGADSSSPDTGPGGNDTEFDRSTLAGNTIGKSSSPTGGGSSAPSSAAGGSANVDSAVQSIFARPGSKTIAGTPYAPSFGKDSDINPAALSAALGAINRPRPGPGLQFGRTTYL